MSLPVEINPNNIRPTSSSYTISRSVRLRSSASAYLNRTFGTPTAGDRFTWSGWVKRGALNQWTPLFNPSYAGGEGLYINPSNQIVIGLNGVNLLVSTSVYRDSSAWMHVLIAADMGNATASLRCRVYVNGVEVTVWATDARASYSTFPYWNKNAVAHYLGYTPAVSPTADGYLTEINFIDGQALAPTSFGQFDSTTGVWGPKKYTGTYGTNGFYLNFLDNSAATATTLGKDSSGNNNNWTPNNISVTAGATYDSMVDVPTLSATASNHCVWNPLTKGASITISNGNLDAVGGVNTNTGNTVLGSVPFSSGKWYAEFKVQNTYSYSYIGVADPANPGSYPGANSAGYSMEVGTGNVYNVSAGTAITGAVAGDIVMCAVDMDNGKIWWGKNGAWGGTGNPAAGTGQQFSGLSGTKVFMLSAYASSGTFNANFGQRPFSYTAPTGFKALNTYNLPDPTIKAGNKWMDVTTYTGNGSTQTIVNSGSMQPDFVWAKARNTAYGSALYDSVRGVLKFLESDATNAEVNGGTGLTSFNTNGFTTTAYNATNANAVTYAAWQWKKGATPGFDIVTYTGTGSTMTVNHSLGSVPKMIISKARTLAGGDTGHWAVQHVGLPSNYLAFLNLTGSIGAVAGLTAPTSTVFTAAVNSGLNLNGATYVAYLFSEVAGFSKFGSYTGNGAADGPFVYCGFRPKFVLVKSTSGAENWIMQDTSRDTYNQANNPLFPNLTNAETAYASSQGIDILSNGFKLRVAGAPVNTSASTYIFAAFAENPFKYALAR